MGYQGLHDAANNASVTEISLADFTKHKPDKTWLRVSGGVLVFPRAVYEEDQRTHAIDEVFIPLLLPTDTFDAKIHVVVASKRPETRALLNEMRRLDHASDAVVQQYLAKNEARLLERRDV